MTSSDEKLLHLNIFRPLTPLQGEGQAEVFEYVSLSAVDQAKHLVLALGRGREGIECNVFENNILLCGLQQSSKDCFELVKTDQQMLLQLIGDAAEGNAKVLGPEGETQAEVSSLASGFCHVSWQPE